MKEYLDLIKIAMEKLFGDIKTTQIKMEIIIMKFLNKISINLINFKEIMKRYVFSGGVYG